MRSYKDVEGISLGMEFEANTIDSCKRRFSGDCIVKVNTADDKFLGTDIVIYGIRCDFTCNFSGKDHMVVLAKSVELFAGIKVKFGVRTGNSHNGYTPFVEPVLVIGIDGADNNIMASWMDKIVDMFARKLDDIIEVGQDQYWDWIDANCPA